jgi:hypothetical protein
LPGYWPCFASSTTFAETHNNIGNEALKLRYP